MPLHKLELETDDLSEDREVNGIEDEDDDDDEESEEDNDDESENRF